MAIDTTNSYIYQQGSAPNTRVAISMKNRIYSTKFGGTEQTQIGVLQTFNYSESRSVDAVRSIGFGDRIVELVPGMTEPMEIRFTRTLLYTSSIIQELGYKGGIDGLVRSLRQHRWPFDLEQQLVMSDLAAPLVVANQNNNQTAAQSRVLITRFLACWLDNYTIDFSSDNALVMEDSGGKATDVINGALYNGINGTNPNLYGEYLESGNSPNGAGGTSIYKGQP